MYYSQQDMFIIRRMLAILWKLDLSDAYYVDMSMKTTDNYGLYWELYYAEISGALIVKERWKADLT